MPSDRSPAFLAKNAPQQRDLLYSLGVSLARRFGTRLPYSLNRYGSTCCPRTTSYLEYGERSSVSLNKGFRHPGTDITHDTTIRHTASVCSAPHLVARLDTRSRIASPNQHSPARRSARKTTHAQPVGPGVCMEEIRDNTKNCSDTRDTAARTARFSREANKDALQMLKTRL